MKLLTVLSEKKSLIHRQWLDSILETYAPDTKKFLKKQKDQFANPVGYTLSHETECLLGILFSETGPEPEKVNPVLDRIIRIRSIQDFTPSTAIEFIYLLKRSVRDALKKEHHDMDLYRELFDFESKIDDLALMSFDIYMRCRENIYEISSRHAMNQVSGLLRKNNLVCEIPEWMPDLRGSKTV